MLSSLYRILTDLGAPFISIYLHRRLATGREDIKRFQERIGYASKMRPRGRLVWCHAASVGEATSLLALIDRIQETHPHLSILVTTGTVTSARMMEGRLPQGALHQFIPVDRMSYVTSFLDYWKPDCALWVESELWPNMLSAIRKRRIPTILLNGRMSDSSFRNWQYMRSWIKEILSTFDLCLTQTENDRERFKFLGARNVQCAGNLKFSAHPLPYDKEQLAILKKASEDRPMWLMASTHKGEEEIAFETHKNLVTKYPNLLTIIVPRHAVRGSEIAALAHMSNLSLSQRSHQQPLTSSTAIYLADTMGELGLFYRLSPIAAIGGSFVAHGGHNPIEPAQLDTTLVFGPYMYNFQAIAEDFKDNRASIALQNLNELTATLDRLLSSPRECALYAGAARRLAEQKIDLLDRVLDALEPWLASSSKNAA